MATIESTLPFTDRIQSIIPSPTMEMSAEAARMKAQGIDLCDLGAGEPQFSTPRHIKDAGIRAIEENFTKYTPVPGIPDLRHAIAERHRTDWNSDFSAEETIFTPGGKYALFLALQTLVQSGDEVIVPVPYWVSFPDMVRYTGATPVYVNADERDGFQVTAERVLKAITPRTRAIILNSPNNPTGAVIPAGDYEEIVMTAHARGIWIISDECYVQLNYADAKDRISAGSFTAAKDSMVVVGSLSKTYAMTGWRCGFALASKPVAQQMAKLQSQSSSSNCAITQKAALAALTGPQDCITTMREEYEKLRGICVAGLNAITKIYCATPRGAFYAYPNISAYLGRAGKTSTEIANRLLREAHVVANPGDTFGTAEHIRLSYAVSSETLAEALRRLKVWFEQQL
jgi:aspartate aminotransferase